MLLSCTEVMLAADKTMDVTWMCGDHLQGEITIGSILSTKDVLRDMITHSPYMEAQSSG